MTPERLAKIRTLKVYSPSGDLHNAVEELLDEVDRLTAERMEVRLIEDGDAPAVVRIQDRIAAQHADHERQREIWRKSLASTALSAADRMDRLTIAAAKAEEERDAARAELAEARAEIAAYQGRPEGALEGWGLGEYADRPAWGRLGL